MNKFIVFLITFLVVLVGYFAFKLYYPLGEQAQEINSFDECVEAGYPVMESYPRQCRTPDGKTFIEDIGNELEKIDLIRINKPRPNEMIKSPLEIEGEARGYWFFEGDFPIKLIDENGTELSVGFAKTSSEWMTEDFVPFEAELEFQKSTTKKGTLILEKDNPSGLPENADELQIPVRFEEPESQLANPAAVYCEEQDGTLEGRILGGGSRGFCIFDDGSECGQWDFFREDCKKGERFCKDLCGDGICQEIVCMVVGCPCAETPKTCPQDCE